MAYRVSHISISRRTPSEDQPNQADIHKSNITKNDFVSVHACCLYVRVYVAAHLGLCNGPAAHVIMVLAHIAAYWCRLIQH